jgi:hypothetical protein
MLGVIAFVLSLIALSRRHVGVANE